MNMLKKLAFSLATVASFSLLAGCAVDSPENDNVDEPVDVTVENADETTPNYSVLSFDCGQGKIFGQYGSFMAGHSWYEYGPPPAASECTAWCTQSCGRSGGSLTLRSSPSHGLGLFTCQCY